MRRRGEWTDPPGGPADPPRPAAPRKAIRLGMDIPLLLVMITMLIFGLLILYSASYDYSLRWYNDSATIFIRQLLWLGFGLVAATTCALLDYHIWQRLALYAGIGTLVALFLVLVANNVLNNAQRTLIKGSVQPSELAKLVTIIYLSVWLFSKRDKLSNIWFGLVPLGALLGIVVLFILLQPDLSAAITIVALGGLMFFLAGGDLRQIGILLLVTVVVGWGLANLFPTGQARIGSYLAGLKDPVLASYHVQRALDAFVRGGLFGVGIGKGETKLTGLPVPPTDSIFAVVGEETGLVGALGVICLFGVLLWRGLTIARRAPDQLGALLASGLSAWIVIEAFINMAVMVNLLPFAGNALPFISSGGSSLVVSLAAIGIILNVSRKSEQREEETWRSFRAVVDLRRWNRRRRVSRSRRPSRVGN